MEITFNNSHPYGGFYFGIPPRGLNLFETVRAGLRPELNAMLALLPEFLTATYPKVTACEIREIYELKDANEYGDTVFVAVSYDGYHMTEIAFDPARKMTVYID